jgi:hypothetical protein
MADRPWAETETQFTDCQLGRAAIVGRMKVLLFPAMLLLAAPLAAETLLVGDQVSVRETTIDMPKRGSTMAVVESRFGAPRTRHEAVGSPPITRWDYEGFSVYFEHQHVIDSVAGG